MVIIHDYSEGQNKLSPSDSSNIDNIDEDRAFVVGIWVVVIFIAMLIVLFVLLAIGRTNQTQTAATSEEKQKEQVLGEKEKTQKETEIKKETPKNVKDLERPLSEEEIIAKAKEIPGSQLHTVVVGESLYTIGEKYNINWQEVADINNLSPPYNLRVGQKLIIPSKGV